jgi:hypothetical protein
VIPIHKPKEVATIIVAGLGADKKEESDEGAPYESAAEAVLAAMDKKDAKALAASLEIFCEMCFTKFEKEPHEEYGEGEGD